MLVGFASFKQPYWPATWIDEGFVMAGAKALVVDGQYAMRSAEEWRTLDQPLIANGPGVVLPVALSMRLFGVGLWQARVPAALFMVAFGLLVYLVACKLSGPAGGLAALAIALAMPHEGFLYSAGWRWATFPRSPTSRPVC